MKLYSSSQNYKLFHGNMLDLGEVIENGTIDAVLTDPPYELNFMGKGWDNSGIAFQPDTWKKCLDALKPGGYLLAFGGSRTYHRIACAIEDAGFEIRDCIMRLYGSGFPKSMNLGKSIESKLLNGTANPKDFKDLDGEKVETGNWGISKMVKEQGARPSDYTEDKHLRVDKVNYKTELGKKYEGRGTCLKPAYEPIIVARKPLEGSCTDNVIKYGVGGINIDECRVESSKEDIEKLNKERDRERNTSYKNYAENVGGSAGFDYSNARVENKGLTGRFPANTILTYGDDDKEEVCSGFHNNEQRYYYTAKASKRDRDEGLDEFEESNAMCDRNPELKSANMPQNRSGNMRKNTHPTVKPTDLMQYLVRLVTPNGGTVLDPFNGSGSTGKAVMYENKDKNKNYKYIGIELTEEYLPIAKARIEYVINKGVEKSEIEEVKDTTPSDNPEQRQETALF